MSYGNQKISEVSFIRLTKDGYTKSGTYFGNTKGEKVYGFRYTRDVIACGSVEELVERESVRFLRARNIRDAKRRLKTEFPLASFDF
jgi:hypothetical protein